jgi:hypothetical protein
MSQGDPAHVEPGVSEEFPEESIKGASPQEVKIFLLKGDLIRLRREGRGNRYEFGQKCKELKDELAHAKTGTYMSTLAELRIPYHTARRAITFYLRVEMAMRANLLQHAKDKEWFDTQGIQDVNELDQILEAEQADARLKQIVLIRDQAIEQVAAAVRKRETTRTGYRIVLLLFDSERETFKKAWLSLGDTKGTSIIFEAVINATTGH